MTHQEYILWVARMIKGFQDAVGNLDESGFNVPKAPGIETMAKVSVNSMEL